MNSDITAGYIITDVERLRKPMQQISDHLILGSHLLPIDWYDNATIAEDNMWSEK